MPLVPNGVYKIHNVKYSPPHVAQKDSQVADLIHGGPGPIDGRPDSQAHNDQWLITNLHDEPTSNEVTIESVKAHQPGIFAYADPVYGALVEGKHHAAVWTLVTRGGKYNIQSTNNNLIWELREPNQNIKLGDYKNGTQEYNEWTFQHVG